MTIVQAHGNAQSSMSIFELIGDIQQKSLQFENYSNISTSNNLYTDYFAFDENIWKSLEEQNNKELLTNNSSDITNVYMHTPSILYSIHNSTLISNRMISPILSISGFQSGKIQLFLYSFYIHIH